MSQPRIQEGTMPSTRRERQISTPLSAAAIEARSVTVIEASSVIADDLWK